MKSMLSLLLDRRALALGSLLALAGCAMAPTPETLPEGLTLVKDSEADVVYVRPGIDFGKYTEFYLVEPNIAFRADWKSDMVMPGGGAAPRVDSEDIARMIELGKKLLAEQFTAELTKGGFALAHKPGPHVLAVKAAITDIYLDVPDPDNLNAAWGRTYSKGSGEGTLQIELFDSVSGQLLARAHDFKDNSTDGYSWRFERTQAGNINDARNAFAGWAQMLVNGLKRAKAQSIPAPAAPAKK